MITFYPRDIGMWRGEFAFSVPITLTPAEKPNCQTFYTRDEFIAFLKDRGVRLDDVNYPLKIEQCDWPHPTLGDGVHKVVQWSLLGWIKYDHM